MSTPDHLNRYHGISIALHWLTLVLVVAIYACIELREVYPKGSQARELLKTWHFMLGLSLFAFVLPRIALRFARRGAGVHGDPPGLQKGLAVAMHIGLYALLIGMPVLGWLLLSAEGKPVPFFGLQLPPLVGESHGLAENVEELHETLGVIGYWLIGLHAAAALFHHYVMRDDTLRRMLPARRHDGAR